MESRGILFPLCGSRNIRSQAPYYTRTRKPKGEKRGGGKGKIHHYLTPVRRNRIIVEMGGELIYEQARERTLV